MTPSIRAAVTTKKLSGNYTMKDTAEILKNIRKGTAVESCMIFMGVKIYNHKDVNAHKLINKHNVILNKIPTKVFMTLYKRIQGCAY